VCQFVQLSSPKTSSDRLLCMIIGSIDRRRHYHGNVLDKRSTYGRMQHSCNKRMIMMLATFGVRRKRFSRENGPIMERKWLRRLYTNTDDENEQTDTCWRTVANFTIFHRDVELHDDLHGDPLLDLPRDRGFRGYVKVNNRYEKERLTVFAYNWRRTLALTWLWIRLQNGASGEIINTII